MKKKIFVFVVVLILIFIVANIVQIATAIKNGNPLLFGSMWKDTPEEAIEYAMNNLPAHYIEEKKNSYKIRNLIDIVKFEKDWYYLYVSEANTFTVTQCCYDPAKDKWSCLSPVVYQYDKSIETTAYAGSRYDLWEMTGYSFFYDYEYNHIFAFLETGVAQEIFFNDIKADVRTYTFEENGKTYSVDCFYVDDFPEGIKQKDVFVGGTYNQN